MNNQSHDKRTDSVESLAGMVRDALNLNLSLHLWDGRIIPLGANVYSKLGFSIASPGVLSSIARRPGIDRLIQHYAKGDIDIVGGTLIDIGEQFSSGGSRKKLKKIPKLKIIKALWPIVLGKSEKPGETRGFSGEISGQGRKQSENKDFIQFHYDVSNDFYHLFLDPEMQYSCAYYQDWNGSLEQAQVDKLEMICRKLRLKKDETFLDIGCGWGGLVCHAAKNYGVKAHGVTLSEEQLAFTKQKIERLGLQDKITVELKDYAHLEGSFDKIASIGMYEHIGVSNIPLYMQTVRRLLADNGLFLNHAISVRAKKGKKRFGSRPEQKALLKYIFPGGELDNIGHTVTALEQHGFEVQDVEAWRYHYARTTRLWCERLTANKQKAIEIVGEETYRIWVAYLAGCSLSFARGSARIYQTLVSKSAKGLPTTPPTRADLYVS